MKKSIVLFLICMSSPIFVHASNKFECESGDSTRLKLRAVLDIGHADRLGRIGTGQFSIDLNSQGEHLYSTSLERGLWATDRLTARAEFESSGEYLLFIADDYFNLPSHGSFEAKVYLGKQFIPLRCYMSEIM